MKKSFKHIVLLLVVLLLIQPETTFAHRMLVEVIEEGVIQVRYDDGTRSGVATVLAYDEHVQVIFEEKVNDDGIVYYDSSINITQIVADDGMGHRATWTTDEVATPPLIPLWLRALLGISILLFIASFFHYRNKQKK